MADGPITITIKGKVGYEDQITVAQAAQIITFLNAEEGQASLGVAPIGGVTPQQRATSPHSRLGTTIGSAREAIEVSGAKTNAEKIVALGEYVMQDGGETFKAEDVKAAFRRARESAPANFSRDLGAAIKAGWIAQGDGDEYYTTSKVEGVLNGGFVFPQASGGGRPRSSGKGSKSKGKPEVFAEMDEFPTTMEGLPGYAKMKTAKDRLLWALEFAKSQGITVGLNNADLAWLTDHLGAGVAGANINASLKSAKKSGLVNRSTVNQTLRITEQGLTHLKSLGADA